MVEESYGCWRKLAVDEMLWLADQNPGKISKKLKRTAGGKLAIRWEDPRKLARSGRKAQPSWASACRWLANRVECITKLLLSVVVGMATEQRATPEESKKQRDRLGSLEQHLKSIVKNKEVCNTLPKERTYYCTKGGQSGSSNSPE